jgi:hypothetical protein
MALSLARDIVIHAEVHGQLFPQDLGQRAAIPQVYPVALSTALFEVHALLRYDPVEPFRSRDGRAEPDLSVRGLLVKYVVVFFGLDFEDTSLDLVSCGL